MSGMLDIRFRPEPKGFQEHISPRATFHLLMLCSAYRQESRELPIVVILILV